MDIHAVSGPPADGFVLLHWSEYDKIFPAMTSYELLFVLKPDFSEAEVEDVAGEVVDAVDKSRGEVVEKDAWGKRELAYEIKGFNKGYYFVWQLKVPGNDVAFLKRNLKLNENILRFLLTKN